ncbi:hypothetical protein [Thalassotalea agariperforans]
MEIIVVIAIAVILFLLWQLYRAKQFNRFKKRIELEITPQLSEHITAQLIASRCQLLPNTQAHIEASILFWTCSKARVIQAALEQEIIDEAWLKNTGNYRNCQHLFFIEKEFLLPTDRIKPIEIDKLEQ